MTTVVIPTTCQLWPSDETNPVNWSPERLSFSQTGNDAAEPATNIIDAPSVGRAMNSITPFGRTSRMTAALDGLSKVPASTTPAFANVFAACSDVTRAMMSPSPIMKFLTSWNESLVPQMSDPAPRTVNVPFSVNASPVRPTAPTGVGYQGGGTVDTTGGLAGNMPWLSVDGSCLVTTAPARAMPVGNGTLPSV